MTLKQLPTRERHAIELNNPAVAEHAKETVLAWAFRVAELGGTVEVKAETKPACCAHCGAVVKASKPVRSEVDACRVRVMRRFYAACKSAGLDVRKIDGMKAALCKYLSLRPGFSRHDLSAGQWAEAVAAVEMGLLAW